MTDGIIEASGHRNTITLNHGKLNISYPILTDDFPTNLANEMLCIILTDKQQNAKIKIQNSS